MADQKTNKDILEIVSELPKDLRDAYFSPATTEAIKETGKNHGLMIDKIGELARETGLVMIGLTPPGEYVKNLTKRLDVDTEKAKAVAEEINQKVFQPVRESLKKIHGLAAIKPFPKKEEVKLPLKPTPPPNLPIEIKQIPPDKFLSKNELKVVVESLKSKEKDKIPSIFVKNIPQPTASQLGGQAPRTESEKLKSELENALNKENQKPNYQSKDPYREPLE